MNCFLLSQLHCPFSGRDSFIKFWCLQTQHCFLTLTGHPGPVWGFAFSPDRNILVSGSSDALLRLWKIRYNVCRFDSLLNYLVLLSNILMFNLSVTPTKKRKAISSTLNVTGRWINLVFHNPYLSVTTAPLYRLTSAVLLLENQRSVYFRFHLTRAGGTWRVRFVGRHLRFLWNFQLSQYCICSHL